MTLTFELHAEDYQAHQLFIFSRSEKMQYRRKRTRLLIVILYLAFGSYFWLEYRYETAVGFFLLAALVFFFYPGWQRKRYKRYYLDLVNEHFVEHFGRTVTIELSAERITAKDPGTETRIRTTELKEIHELPAYIFLVFKGNSILLIPKDRLDNVEEVIQALKEIARDSGASYQSQDTWEWA